MPTNSKSFDLAFCLFKKAYLKKKFGFTFKQNFQKLLKGLCLRAYIPMNEGT